MARSPSRSPPARRHQRTERSRSRDRGHRHSRSRSLSRSRSPLGSKHRHAGSRRSRSRSTGRDREYRRSPGEQPPRSNDRASRSRSASLNRISRRRSDSRDRSRYADESDSADDTRREQKKHKKEKKAKKSKKHRKETKDNSQLKRGDEAAVTSAGSPRAMVHDKEPAEQSRIEANDTKPVDVRSFFERIKAQEAEKEGVGTVHASGFRAPNPTSLVAAEQWECVKRGCGQKNNKKAAACSKCGAMKRLSEWR